MRDPLALPVAPGAFRTTRYDCVDGVETLRVLDIQGGDQGILLERRVWMRDDPASEWSFDERVEWNLSEVEALDLFSGLSELLER